jgi:SAM-dependent methyltransferase
MSDLPAVAAHRGGLARRARGKWISGSVASVIVATTGSDRTGFSDVDASGGPDYFIEYLDGARRQPVIAQSKEWSLQQLHLGRGHRALDIGCGTGDDVVAMAALVGPTGEAIGLDSSQAMIAEATKRHRQVPQVSFQVSDAHWLPFESASFDGCRAERILQHVSDPGQVMREITRILKGGGRVALVEPDWETLIIEGSDPAVSAVIWRNHMKRHRHPRIGRSLRGLLTANGFADVTLAAGVVIHTEFEHSKRAFGLGAAASSATAAGLVTEREAQTWLADLQQASATRQFFCALTAFRAAGYKE